MTQRIFYTIENNPRKRPNNTKQLLKLRKKKRKVLRVVAMRNRMKHISTFNPDSFTFNITKGKDGAKCEDVFTFDTETSSIFITPNGNTIHYDNVHSEDFWRSCQKYCVCYIWMFSVQGVVYYSRDTRDFPKLLEKLDEKLAGAKYKIWVHNLGFDFEVMRGLLKVDELFCRNKHKPYRISLKDSGCVFEDSLVLANMGLEQVAKDYKLKHKKQVGKLDYTKIRNPSTPLTKQEMDYCEFDCRVLDDYITYKLEKYGSVWSIPMTQTGEVRSELKHIIGERFKSEFFGVKLWKQKMAAIRPDWEQYKMLIKAFAGGSTNANPAYIGKVQYHLKSRDETSAYPTMLLTKAFPWSKPKELDPATFNLFEYDDVHKAYVFDITIVNFQSAYLNNYLSKSKCEYISRSGTLIANGRVVRAREVRFTCTEQDWNIIRKAYAVQPYEVRLNRCIEMRKRYLPKEVVKLIVEFYKNKSKYKGVAGMEAFYTFCKQQLNSVYGMFVYKAIRDEVYYDDDIGWYEENEGEELTIEQMDGNDFAKYVDLEGDELLPYCAGVWCSAYNRAALWSGILAHDKYVVYYDTDSLKLLPGYDEKWFDSYNKKIAAEIDACCERNGLDPKDLHPLGEWDPDGDYYEFMTLGAKRYCYRYEPEYAKKMAEKAYKKSGDPKDLISDLQLHITVSGVSKKAAIALNDDILNFRDGFVFTPDVCGKKLVYYISDQKPQVVTDYLGNSELIDWQTTGVCLQPTGYVMGVTEELEEFCGSKYLKKLCDNT